MCRAGVGNFERVFVTADTIDSQASIHPSSVENHKTDDHPASIHPSIHPRCSSAAAAEQLAVFCPVERRNHRSERVKNEKPHPCDPETKKENDVDERGSQRPFCLARIRISICPKLKRHAAFFDRFWKYDSWIELSSFSRAAR